MLLKKNQNSNHNIHHRRCWVYFSQDTISKNGTPGKRQRVEDAVRAAINEGNSVVVDRMHLTEEQRSYFVQIGRDFNNNNNKQTIQEDDNKTKKTSKVIRIHALLLNPPKNVISNRIRNRTNHPGKVEGEKWSRMVLGFLKQLELPTYKEGFDLIFRAKTDNEVTQICNRYKRVVTTSSLPTLSEKTIATNNNDDNESVIGPRTPRDVLIEDFHHFTVKDRKIKLPSVILGTMNIGKRKAPDVIKTAMQLGFAGVDTAPTYNNEQEVGMNLNSEAFVIVKIPKRVTTPEQVRVEVEASLAKLNRKGANLLLLHWPCDVMDTGSLQSVWGEMEKCLTEYHLCESIGVCNFSIPALHVLLQFCSIPPCVNQIERHPLLPQTELLLFCANQGIIIQAHTPLGGKTGNKVLLQENDTIRTISKDTQLSPAQVVLLWNLQQGVAIVTKCSTKEHMGEILSMVHPKNHANNDDHHENKIESISRNSVTTQSPVPQQQQKHPLLFPEHMMALDNLKEPQKRFVSPPFMFPRKVQPYSW